MNLFFKTPRLLITELHWEDRFLFHKLQSDHQVFTYLGKTAQEDHELNNLELLSLIELYKHLDQKRLIMAVRVLEQQRFIGTCALYENEEGFIEIGFRLLPEKWGKGLASELIPNLIAFGFEKFHVDFLCAYVFDDHKASIRAVESSGMRLKKVFYNEEHQRPDRFYTIMKGN